MAAYFNENDPQKAAWLRELIKGGHIAAGDVDERSIKDVQPNDVRGYTQAHWFGGVGAWSYALRCAGWPDERPAWTGSCPCQSFSVAGKRTGFADERHLWPVWFRLIAACKPTVVFGEQVKAAIRHGWLDLVQSDLEGAGYAVGAAVFGACSVGAPHMRQRLYFVADTMQSGRPERRPKSGDRQTTGSGEVGGMADTQSQYRGILLQQGGPQQTGLESRGCGATGNVADTEHAERRAECKEYADPYRRNGFGRSGEVGGMADTNGRDTGGRTLQRSGEYGQFAKDGSVSGMADADHAEWRPEMVGRHNANGCASGRDEGDSQSGEHREINRTGPVNGFWRDADWIFCRDRKWRPVESSNERMVNGLAAELGFMRFGGRYSLNPLIQKGKNRVMRLRGYGDAVVAEVAKEFIKAYMEIA